MRYLVAFTFLLLSFTACVYEPEQFEEESADSSSSTGNSSSGTASDFGSIFTINRQSQICNPSVSQDTVNFPASMLWLNFGGTLNVTPSDSGYKTTKASQHDRLTITNRDNEVLWYMMLDASADECQFQDPEWSTHPDFLVALSAHDSVNAEDCDESNFDYGIFAVRTVDKSRFWFVKKGIGTYATPHVWVDPSAVVDTSDDATTVEGFFGTKNVRLVYVNPDNEIVFVDYANGGMKKAVTLKKSESMGELMVDSPMISPDGKFIVFNVFKGGTNSMASYVQELSANSTPVEIKRTSDMVSVPIQPHWFTFGGRLFVTWAETPSGSYFVDSDLSKEAAQDGSAGRTVMREVSLNAGAPADLFLEWIGDVREIAPVPMTGGRSPDGRYLATGYKYGYMLELP